MKKILLIYFVFFVVIMLSGCESRISNPAVKKSNTGICHQKGTNYYEKTKNFTAYNSIDECLKSGGRLPKK